MRFCSLIKIGTTLLYSIVEIKQSNKTLLGNHFSSQWGGREGQKTYYSFSKTFLKNNISQLICSYTAVSLPEKCFKMNLFIVLSVLSRIYTHLLYLNTKKWRNTKHQKLPTYSEMLFRISTNKSCNPLLQPPFTTTEPRLQFFVSIQKHLDLLLICSKLSEKQYNFWNRSCLSRD